MGSPGRGEIHRLISNRVVTVMDVLAFYGCFGDKGVI